MEQQIKQSKTPLILGVIGLFTWLVPFIGAIVSIVGIIISNKNLKVQNCKAYKIGLGLNIAGLVITIINFIVGFYITYNKLA